MNKFIVTAVLICFCCSGIFSQTIDWANLKKKQPHLLNIHAGVEHGLIFGAGYGYLLRSKLPIVLNAAYSFPAGNHLFDDFKTTIGTQVNFYQAGNFLFSAKCYGIFRRYESDLATLLDFGTDLSATAGYYKSKWFVAVEAGFDKAIITHFKHTESYKSLFPGVKDGWYEPATGGNFYYGLQAGYSKSSVDFYVKAGKIINENFRTPPLIPVYLQAGVNLKIAR